MEQVVCSIHGFAMVWDFGRGNYYCQVLMCPNNDKTPKKRCELTELLVEHCAHCRGNTIAPGEEQDEPDFLDLA